LEALTLLVFADSNERNASQQYRLTICGTCFCW